MKIERRYIIKVLDKIAEWSLYILIFTLPFSKSIVEITIVTALVSLVVRKVITRERAFSSISHVEILLFISLVLSLPSFVNTSYVQLSVRALFTKTLKFAALFLIIKEIINTKEKLINVVKVAASSCGMILIDGFIQHFITHIDLLHNYPSFLYVKFSPSVLGNPTASFPFPNDYAAWILIFIFPTAICTILSKINWKNRLMSGVLFLGLLYSLILVRVRGAWMAFIASFAFASIFKLKKMGMLLLMMFLLAAVVIDKSVISHMSALTSLRDRGAMWTGGWKIFKQHPVIGNGINSFFLNYAKVREDEYKNKKGSYAHNCYLQMAAETGLIGLISFLVFAAALILKGLRAAMRIKDPMYNSLAFGITLGLMAFLIHSAVDTNLYSLNLAALFWFSAGFLMAIVKIAESNS